MRWLPPRPADVWCLVSVAATAGCGRLGFDELRKHHGSVNASKGPDGQSNGERGATSGAGIDAGSPDAESPGASSSTDAQITASSDGSLSGGTRTGDGGFGDGDGNLSPLPTQVDCSTIKGNVACDNFDGSASGAPVVLATTNATGSVMSYLRAYADGDEQGADVEAECAAFSSGGAYLRFSLFVPLDASFRAVNIASIGRFSSSDYGIDLDVFANGELQLSTSGDDVDTSSGSYRLPRGRWVCIRLEADTLDHADGSLKLFVEDTLVFDESGRDTLPSNGVAAAAAGINWTWDQQGPVTLYVDNFVFAREPPGPCP